MSIHIENIDVSIGEKTLMKSFSMQIENGRFCLVGGESGIGKTTLLNVISGLKKIDKGQITLNNVIINNESEFILPEERNIGYVFQDYALFPHINVHQNITFASNGKRKDLFSRIIEELKLDEHITKMPNELSGGLQQRVAIARALMMKPSLLLLDEPCSNLDKENSDNVQNLLKWFVRKYKIPCIIVSHDFDLFDKIEVTQEINLS